MEINIEGNLLLERNPMFVMPDQSLGVNTLKYIILTSFDETTITLLKNLQRQYNHDQPIKDQYSLPFNFGFYNGSHYAQVQIKLRNPKSDTLLKLIDFTSSIIKLPLASWIGRVFKVRAKVLKYNFTEQQPDLIEGGSKKKLRGIALHIKCISS